MSELISICKVFRLLLQVVAVWAGQKIQTIAYRLGGPGLTEVFFAVGPVQPKHGLRRRRLHQ